MSLVTGLGTGSSAAAKFAGGLFDAAGGPLANVGWSGFLDGRFMADSIGALLLAVILGAVIGYHPITPRTVDNLHEADMPKVYILYAFIGAVIGVTVREFGMVIGVVIFGIGGLIRFRTDAGSTRDNGRLIAVTLTGLIAGLGLPHLAVIVTAFAFALIWFFDSKPACRLRVEQIPAGRLAESADHYHQQLLRHGCRIISQHRSFGKDRVVFVLRLPRVESRETVQAALSAAPPELRGEIEWDFE